MKIEMRKAEEEEARLTAYALGELDADGVREVDELLNRSEEARAALEEIRSTAALLAAGFSEEPPLSLHNDQVKAITSTSAGKIVRGSFFSTAGKPLLAAAACACLLAAVGLKQYLAGLEDKNVRAAT